MVHELTGYSITDIKDCLHMLAVFSDANLQSDQLDSFDISTIKNVERYN